MQTQRYTGLPLWRGHTPKIRDGIDDSAGYARRCCRRLWFIKALAVYEREPDAVTATEEDLLRDGFGPRPYYQCLIAE